MSSIKVKQLECLSCGYKWFPRISRDGQVKNPLVCSNCKSRSWDKKKGVEEENEQKND